MRFKLAALVLSSIVWTGCSQTSTPVQNTNGGRQATTASPNANANASANASAATAINASLPSSGFRAQLAVQDPPAKMRSGQQSVLQVRVKNMSDVNWPALGEADGRFAITLRDRWLTAGTSKVVNDIDGGASLPHDLAPGAEIVLSLKVTAPANRGAYDLEVDMVQERVSFFREKGSQPAKVSVTVE